MKIVFTIAHPAHVHLFKNPISILQQHGNEIKIAVVAKEDNLKLLDAYNFVYETIGRSEVGTSAKALTLLGKNLRLLKICKSFEPDILVSTGSPYAAHTSALIGKPHIAFGDTEIASLITHLMQPFTDAICTPACFQIELGPKHIRYDGYHELAYLHPNYFSPDRSILDRVGLHKDDKIIVVRFSSWDASHDIGQSGFGFQQPERLKFLKRLEQYGRVVVVSEIPLGKEFDKYRLSFPPEKLHDLLAFSTLYIGEGATMASEAGVLGVPWIFVSSAKRGYLDDQQYKYGLGYTISNSTFALEKAIFLLKKKDLKVVWQRKREKLLSEKIDVTKFIVEFIEDWPTSFERLRKNSNRMF